MKTIKLLLATTFLFLSISCSKDNDGSEPTLDYTQKNLMGRYAITSMTKENGQVIPYKGFCATKPDIFVALSYEKVYIEKYNSSCPANYYDFSVASNYSIRPDGRLVNNNQSTDGYCEGRITELTATKFRVVYDEPSELNSHNSEPGQINKYTSILYTRL